MKRKVLYLIMCLLAITFANAQVTSVAIVGEAVGGWPGDVGNPGPTDVHQMTSTDGITWTLAGLVVNTAALNGGAKFRANNAWTINWGNAAFPSGTGTQSGANILTIAGTYDVTFNSTTGDYSFTGGAPIPVIHLFGSAVNAPPEGVLMTTADAITYTVSNITLLPGNAQFDIDASVAGGNTFPTGTIVDATQFIPVAGGTYTSVSLNLETGVYNFVLAPVYPGISIVGSGTPGGWPSDPQIDQHQLITTDGITYKLEGLLLSNGEVKFRENNSWNPNNWGGTTFPTGTGVLGSSNNIPTTAGVYTVTFNRTTLEYSFTFPVIALVGSATPAGWPVDPQVDPYPLTTTDGVTYTLDHITLLDGAAKFRKNNNWDVSWGTAAFPSGIAGQPGNDIPVTAGNYHITFDLSTLAFNFTPTLATTGFASKNLKVYPNPTTNNWNFTSNEAISSVQIVDVLGKVVSTATVSSTAASIDASALSNGIYFAKIATETATETVKLIKN